MSSQLAFSEAVTTITNRIAGKNIDGKLQAFLNENFPPGVSMRAGYALMNGVASGTDASLTRVPKRTAFPSTSC
jgi:hypothetical protein